jgi:hypothetical protein
MTVFKISWGVRKERNKEVTICITPDGCALVQIKRHAFLKKVLILILVTIMHTNEREIMKPGCLAWPRLS